MPLRTRWANDYTECFRGQDEGWAVYPPIKSSALKPGMCGYFDVDGIWQTIVDLTNPDDVQSKNLPAVHDVEFSSGNLADTKHWGLRKSKDVSQEDITAQVMAKYVSLRLNCPTKFFRSNPLTLTNPQSTRGTGWREGFLQVLCDIK